MSKNDKRVFDVLVVWISFCVLAHSSELGALWPSQKPKSSDFSSSKRRCGERFFKSDFSSGIGWHERGKLGRAERDGQTAPKWVVTAIMVFFFSLRLPCIKRYLHVHDDSFR